MIFYRPISKPKALTFDLDDTLYDNHPAIIRAEKLLNAKMAEQFPRAAALTREQRWAIKRELISQDHRLAWDMGELRRQTLKLILAEEAGDSLEQATEDLFDYFYAVRSEIEIDKNIHSLMKSLSDRLPLVAITNGNVDTDKIGLAPYFTQVLHATLDKPAKPHRNMFDIAAQQLGLPAQHILHVGDGMTNDICGAYEAGYMSAWYACNRTMRLPNESVSVLPNVQLTRLEDLLLLTK